MRVLDPGHRYALGTLDGEVYVGLQFVNRVGPGFPGNIRAHPGTTTQEVLRALIDRARYVNAQIPCWQTGVSVVLMRLIIWLYEHRAAKRHGRKPFPLTNLGYIEQWAVCLKCGHIGCKEECHGGH